VQGGRTGRPPPSVAWRAGGGGGVERVGEPGRPCRPRGARGGGAGGAGAAATREDDGREREALHGQENGEMEKP
jgi:hypothetical protein